MTCTEQFAIYCLLHKLVIKCYLIFTKVSNQQTQDF